MFKGSDTRQRLSKGKGYATQEHFSSACEIL